MAQWYEKLGAQIGLRVAGLALLISVWFECGLLHKLAMETPAADITGVEFLLAALIFLSASGGTALAIVAGGLWTPAKVSDRWAESAAVPGKADRKHGSDQKGKIEG